MFIFLPVLCWDSCFRSLLLVCWSFQVPCFLLCQYRVFFFGYVGVGSSSVKFGLETGTFLENKFSWTLPPPYLFRQMIYRNEGHLKCWFLVYEIYFSDRVTVNRGLFPTRLPHCVLTVSWRPVFFVFKRKVRALARSITWSCYRKVIYCITVN